jgi:hypothetical protein
MDRFDCTQSQIILVNHDLSKCFSGEGNGLLTTRLTLQRWVHALITTSSVEVSR